MVHDRFHRLHPDTPRLCEAGRPQLMISHAVRTKPITHLLLVNKQIGSEYRDACEKRFGVIVSNYLQFLDPAAELSEEIHSWNVEKASFIHMHAGDWMSSLLDDDHKWTLSSLTEWFAHWSSQMPKLDSITVSIYLSFDSVKQDEECEKLEAALRKFVSLPKLMELKVITMNDGIDWRSERGPSSKSLLVHWTRNSAHKPTLIGFPPSYVEPCCKCLDGPSSDSNAGNGDDGAIAM